MPLPKEVTDYTARIEDIGRRNPTRLVAHAYVRYLGDLSGGQYVKRIISKAYSLDDSSGLSFYDFFIANGTSIPHKANSGDLLKLKAQFREGMDSFITSEEDKDLTVQEAIVAFRLNQGLLALLPFLIPSKKLPIMEVERPAGKLWSDIALRTLLPSIPAMFFACLVSYIVVWELPEILPYSPPSLPIAI
jgi:hypothetical protein